MGKFIAMVLSVLFTSGHLPAARAEESSALLLVFPVFGTCPPEMSLPWAGHLAESLLLELPGSELRVEAQEPAQAVLSGGIEPMARQRAAELGAQAILWGELVSSKDCSAPRMIRLKILELSSDAILIRDICPEKAAAEDVSRAMALAAANALRAGELESIRIDQAQEELVAAPEIPKAPSCPKCPESPDCPPCPRAAPIQTVCPKAESGWLRPFGLAVGGSFSSHPDWDSAGFGASIQLSYAPLGWLELGLGVTALHSQKISSDRVKANYNAWPVKAWIGFRLGEQVQGVARIGATLAWSRLDALLEEEASSLSVGRLNPVLFGSLGLRYWIGWGVAVQLFAGPSWFLRRQRYTYSLAGAERTVMAMRNVSLDLGLGLLAAF